MLPPIDASRGDKFLIKDQGASFVATYVKPKSNGELVFERADRRERWYIERKRYIFMRARGHAVRLDPGHEDVERFAVEPGAFEPELPGDSPKVKARKKRYLKAVIKQYYVMCIDEYDIPCSNEPIRKFIEDHASTHKQLFGKEYKAPGASSLIRYTREYGSKHYRPFAFFLNNSGGDQKSGLWADVVKLLKWTMLEWYWSPLRPSDRAAKAWFNGEIAKERKRRLALVEAGDQTLQIAGATSRSATDIVANTPQIDVAKFLAHNENQSADFASPCDATLQNWIDRAATLANIARREGRTVANRQIEGVHASVVTHRPLQCVVMDHTQIDMHVVVYNDKGTIVEETSRPWLIVVMDVHTRMVLAARLSIRSPSLETLNAGLKQTLKPKDFLQHLNTGDAYAWSLDCFGKFKRMLVDNDLANIGRSLRASASFVGLHVSFAPVKTPPYKAIVERFFKTLNTNIWHEADGGVAEKPGVSDQDPRKSARFTLPEAQEKLWNWIITVYHLAVHDELGVPPAFMWKESFESYTRPLVADMSAIDQVFGKAVVRTLTTSGIEYRKEVFHHPDVVTSLLDDLCHLVRNPRGTKRKNNTRSVEIELTEQETVAAIAVYNPARGIWVEIPNEDTTRTSTYEDAVVERGKRNDAIENFFSRNDLAINKANHFSSLTSYVPPAIDLPSSSEPVDTALSDGRSSGHRLAAQRRNQVVVQRPCARRGGKAATAKGSNTRAENEARKDSAVRDRVKLTKAPKVASVVEPSRSIEPDPMEAAENLKTLVTANPFKIVDGNAYLERMKSEIKVSRE